VIIDDVERLERREATATATVTPKASATLALLAVTDGAIRL
jgi:hypothetical protein